MKVLILGAQGLLGRALQGACRHEKLLAWSRRDCDIAAPEAYDLIVRAQPQAVVNAAAWTDVDGAEEPGNRDMVFRTNSEALARLAAACNAIDAHFLHISTNEVFAGQPVMQYTERDMPAPVNTYGRSKAEGEMALAQDLHRHCIVRVSWLFGLHGEHFPGKIVRAADRLGHLRVVNDEFGCPTFADDAARRVHQLLSRRASGIFHVTNRGIVSRCAWARFVLDHTGRADVGIRPISSTEWERPAAAPRHAVLRDTRLAQAGIETMPTWQDAMHRFLQAASMPAEVAGCTVNNRLHARHRRPFASVAAIHS